MRHCDGLFDDTLDLLQHKYKMRCFMNKKKGNLKMIKISAYDDFCTNPECNWTSDPYFAFERVNKRTEKCLLCEKTKITHRDTSIPVKADLLHLLEVAHPGIDIKSFIISK